MQIAVQRLRKVVNFGAVDSVENDNTGDYDTKFLAQFSKHYADYREHKRKVIKLMELI